mgnify:CR=1 FL=1
MAFLPVKYKFTTEFSVIDYNTGEYQDFNNCLNGIAIKKNYLNNVYPLYVLSMSVTYKQREYLVSNKFYVALNNNNF